MSALLNNKYDGLAEWESEWKKQNTDKHNLIQSPLTSIEGTLLKRYDGVTLDRIRTGHGRYGEIFYKWNINGNPACDCGAPSQFIQRIITDCPVRGFKGTINDTDNVTEVAIVQIQKIDLKL